MFDPSQPSFVYPLPFPPPLPPGTVPQTHLGFQPQPSFVHHPNWIVGESSPITYGSVTITPHGHENSSSVTDPNSFWANQPPNPTAMSGVPSQTTRCDICNVDCISKAILEKHFQGKKHINKSQAVAILGAANAMNRISLPSQATGNVGPTASGSDPDLEMKRRKVLKSGSTVDSVRVCTTCNVVCNSEDVYHKHMTGKKHAVQANLASLGEVGPYLAAIRAQFESNFKKAPKKVKMGQSQWCEVCKISCNSKEVYATHVSGKKHQNNLGQLTLTAGVRPEENPEAKKSTAKPPHSKKASQEEMAAKTQKVVEAGAATAAIRTCSICNVVCNSRTVFEYHLSGQKHKDMVKNLQDSQTS